MRNKITIDLFCAGAALLLAGGCTVNDPIYDSVHPGKGKVTLTTDWSARTSGVDIPASYTVMAGDYSATLNEPVNTLDHLFEPGSCRFYLYNTPEHISVSGATVTVAGAPGHPEDEGPFVQEPGWLFTSAVDATIRADADQEIKAVMHQQVRQLTIFLEPSGTTADRIERIEGYLSGVASTLNTDDGTHGGPSNAALTFTKVADGPDAGKWSATVRLLGVAGDRQVLHTTVGFPNDDPAPMTAEDDLSEALKDFNADKATPLAVGSEAKAPSGIRDVGDLIDFVASWNETTDDAARAEVIALWSRERTPEGTIYLEANLDMTNGSAMAPIGASVGFTGTFDGGGHTISGLNINGQDNDNAGLFGINAGTIRNVNLENCTVETTGSAAGGLAGMNRGTISNCHVTNGTITSGTESPNMNSGGIVGWNNTGGRIENCTVKGGAVNARSNAGGIAGQVNAQSVITGCRVTDTCFVTVAENSSGGIAGSLNNNGTSEPARITDCHTAAIVVKANMSAGGIAGENSRSVIENCTVNVPNVNSTVQDAGGVVGFNSYGTVTNCEVTGGIVQSLKQNSGGIAGYTSSGAIENCRMEEGKVIASSYSGGIAGVANGPVRGCTVTNGNVRSGSASGGVAGYNKGTIADCDVKGGKVTAQNSLAGGIAGWNYTNCKIEGCHVTDGTEISVPGGNNAGGIVAQNDAGATVTGCRVTDGKVSASGMNVGGIAGQLNSTNKPDVLALKDCHVLRGTVEAMQRAGGIAGSNASGRIEDCSITDGEVMTTAAAKEPDGCYAGGIAGYSSRGTILNSAMKGGTVTAGFRYGGGIAGYTHTGTIGKCTVDGAVVTVKDQYAGGIVSSNYQSTVTGCSVTDSEVSITERNVNGAYCGGIAGENRYGTISGSRVTGGVVTSAGSYMGGVTGYNPYEGKIEGCVVMNVTVERYGTNSVQRAGGIVGWNVSGGTVSGCAFIGGKVNASSYVGGLVGFLNGGSVTSCIAAPESMGIGTSPCVIAGSFSSGNLLNTYGVDIGFVLARGTTDSNTIDCGLFKASEVTAAGNFFTEGNPSRIGKMNEALTDAGVTVRWKAGDASSNWYPLPEVYE